MVLVTVAISAAVATPQVDIWKLLFILAGVALVAASGSAVNQFIERYSDWLMPRTASRPLPAQRLTAREVSVFAAVTIGCGLSLLATMVNWQAALVALITWILYSFVYTPLKAKTSLNTYVGAVAGALPVLIGVVGLNAGIPPIGWALFAILFIWQFPHFMAIAWKYRFEYAEGGLVMFPVSDPSGRSTGWHALVFAVLHFPVGAYAIWLMAGLNPWFHVAGLALATLYLWPSIKFWQNPNKQTSRSLLLASIIYLPLMFLLVLMARMLLNS